MDLTKVDFDKLRKVLLDYINDPTIEGPYNRIWHACVISNNMNHVPQDDIDKIWDTLEELDPLIVHSTVFLHTQSLNSISQEKYPSWFQKLRIAEKEYKHNV